MLLFELFYWTILVQKVETIVTIQHLKQITSYSNKLQHIRNINFKHVYNKSIDIHTHSSCKHQFLMITTIDFCKVAMNFSGFTILFKHTILST